MSRSIVWRRLLIGVALFVLFSLPVAVLQPVFSYGQDSVVEAKTIKKKKVKKKVKKTVKKSVKKSGQSNSEVNADVSTFKNANYQGPFPAPEGMVLEGTSGEDQFKEPTGDGAYRFRIQTAWKNDLACLDKTRTVIDSKGKTWDEGWYQGHSLGTSDYAGWLSFDDTPKAGKAGNEFYDEGYRLGYDRGYKGYSVYSSQYYCKGHDVPVSDYDDDGWYKVKHDKLPSVKAVYLPPHPYGGMNNASKSTLGNDAVSFTFDLDLGDLNKGKPPLNIVKIDALEGDLDAAEAKMTTKEFAQAFYDMMKTKDETKYKGQCKYDAPAIEEKTYGSNTFVNLNYLVLCSSLGFDSGDGNWILGVYSFMKLPNNKMLMLNVFDKESVKAKGKNELDASKLPNVDFIDQFYSKMQIAK